MIVKFISQDDRNIKEIRLRTGKGSELVVAAKLIENGIDVFLPLIDRSVDVVIQVKDRFYHYKHKGDKKDEFFYLTKDQMKEQWLPESDFKDVVLKKEDRKSDTTQTIENLSIVLKGVQT
ncbi:MAG: hypothetical protein FVQ79_09010 [Planctomycetes bacterium]|nr:hypothetical protein [Planctomycetota bacterium]